MSKRKARHFSIHEDVIAAIRAVAGDRGVSSFLEQAACEKLGRPVPAEHVPFFAARSEIAKALTRGESPEKRQ